MKIEAITLRELHMPLVHFFETSFGRIHSRRVLLITAHGEGINGWGECVADETPSYSEEFAESAWLVIERILAPAILGKTLESGRDCVPAFARVRGHRMAKAAIENAIWDMDAQQKQVPLWKLLGGTRKEIPCGVSIGIQDSVEQLLDKIAIELAAGYRRIKMKIKPGWDVDVVRRVRERFPSIKLMADANSAYTLADTAHLKRLDEFYLMMIEQPLAHDDIIDHAELQRQLQTPIC